MTQVDEQLAESIVKHPGLDPFWDYLPERFWSGVVAELYGVISAAETPYPRVDMLRDIIVQHSGEWYRETLIAATEDWESILEQNQTDAAPAAPPVAPPKPPVQKEPPPPAPPKAPPEIPQREPQLAEERSRPPKGTSKEERRNK